MDTDLKFPVSAVLPATPEGAALARFLILARQAEHLHKALPKLDAPKDGATREATFMLTGCFIGSLKELADAFRDMRSQGFLSWIENGVEAPADLKADLAKAVAGTNKADPNSLYCKLLKRLRDSAGFHVRRNDVQEILQTLADLPVKVATVVGPNQQIQSIPAVEFLMGFLLLNDPTDVDTLADTFSDAQALYMSLRNVAHDRYLIHVRFATELDGQTA